MAIQSITHQTIALAGIAQACVLVEQLATTGQTDHKALEASINSILQTDPESVQAVYGGLGGIKLGLTTLKQQLTGQHTASPQQARYAASLIVLEKQLSSRPDMLKTIADGINKAKLQTGHFGLLHDNVLANLGDLYHQTISTLSPRIMVNGDPQYLSNQATVNKIRALLLAGIRSAMLWRQCGGARWKFLFFRKKYQDEVIFLLSQLD
jgi:high frequency lysogenization protein